jgi:hypothetical protein
MTDESRLITEIRARRAAGIADLGAEMRRRVRDFGSIRIDSDLRREAFSELTAPFEVSPYRVIVRDDSFVDSAAETVVLRMGLVEVAAAAEAVFVATIERTFVLGEGQVHHQRMEVADGFRGRAIAPRIMLASFDRYDQLGMRTVTVHAGLGTGRFYWSGKVGFDFLRNEDQRHVERWATFVLGALNLPVDLDGISRPQQWALLGTTSDTPPTASFSDLASRVTKVSTVLLDPNQTGVVGSVEAKEVEVEPGMVDLPAHLRRIAEANGIGWDADIALGKLVMLTGPDWLGVFDLTDPVSRSAYEASANQAIRKAMDREARTE